MTAKRPRQPRVPEYTWPPILPGTTIGGEVETFSVDFTIRNQDRTQSRTLNGTVDTGASYTIIPEQILDEMGIVRDEQALFQPGRRLRSGTFYRLG